MCGLCSNDQAERDNERDRMLAAADCLSDLADKYRKMAHREIKPHSEDSKMVALLANRVIRGLVEEWL